MGEQDEVRHLFCNLTFEWAQLHFCHVLFIASQSLGPTRIQGEGITQGHAYEDSGPKWLT